MSAAETAAVTAAAVKAETAEDQTAAVGAAASGEAPPPPQPPERTAAAVEPIKPLIGAFTVTGGRFTARRTSVPPKPVSPAAHRSRGHYRGAKNKRGIFSSPSCAGVCWRPWIS